MIGFRFAIIGMTLLGLAINCPAEIRPYQKGDKEHGYASWYGADSGTKTASGEKFDQESLTGAHRYLPFNSIVRVTNKLNGLSVEVRINDRGPWGKSRVIDISESAAKILKMKGAGIVPVDLVVLTVGKSQLKKAK